MFSPDPRGLQAPMRLPAFERSQVSGLSSVFRKPTPLQEVSTGLENKIEEEESPIRTQMASRNGGDIGGDSFDVAANEDAKSPGYPEGPVIIYEPHVYLYLEPTAEEASKFDVIMNVASEVKNPFTNPKPAKKESVSMPLSTFDSMDIDRDNIPEPATAATMATFRTAFEYQPSDASATPTETSPTTPKPATKQPEYIHIPWEHNTDITKDLMWLCETIDERVKDGKKVLVHCQQGASRSASLIIAYGMYRTPWLTVDAAYNAAQERSRWICPNINLMYALQDFHKALKNRRTRTGKSPTKHRMTLSADEIEFSPKEPPQTAPLPIDRDGSGVNGTSPVRTPPHMRNNSTPNFGEISPGPSSAPSSFPWTPKADKTPNFGLWPDNSSPKPTFGSFNFKNESRNKYSAASNFGSAPKPQIDTPPSSQPASPPMLPGFASHRQEHSAKRKPAPFLLFKPLPPPPTVCETPIDNIKPQFTSLPMVNPPVTPGLWSPRIQEMAGNNVQKSFGVGFGFGAPYQQASTQKHEHKYQKIEIEVPPTPSIMSPRVEGFNINPFAQVFDTKIVPIERPKTSLGGARFGGSGVGGGSSFLGSLGFGGMSFGNGMMASFGTLKPLPPPPSLMLRRELERKEKENAGGSKVNEANGLNKALPLRVDPRSPPLRGEAGIIRSIDDVL
jgi:tyrosine-protein phosphatase